MESNLSFLSEFKADAVKLVNSSSRPVTQIARELGVSESALRAWIKKVGNENDGVKPMSMEEQLKLGKRENEEL
ncbi:MAG: transposase [Actinobacteria bacterium]|nr:transposase [Actinomycetota bacterium]MCL6104335.1 transposase [Actinomycetota bacterium]